MQCTCTSCCTLSHRQGPLFSWLSFPKWGWVENGEAIIVDLLVNGNERAYGGFQEGKEEIVWMRNITFIPQVFVNSCLWELLRKSCKVVLPQLIYVQERGLHVWNRKKQLSYLPLCFMPGCFLSIRRSYLGFTSVFQLSESPTCAHRVVREPAHELKFWINVGWSMIHEVNFVAGQLTQIFYEVSSCLWRFVAVFK